MQLDHFANTLPCHSSFNHNSLYVLEFDYGGYRKPFLAQLLHKLDIDATLADILVDPEQTFLGPSMIISPLAGFNHEYIFGDTVPGPPTIQAISEEHDVNPLLEMDILLRANQIIKQEDLYFLVKAIMSTYTKVDDPNFYKRLLAFDSVVDPVLQEKILGPYYLMYNLASLVLGTNFELWKYFWSLNPVGRWDMVTEQLAMAYNAVPKLIEDFKKQSKAESIRPNKEPRSKQSKPKEDFRPEPEKTPAEIIRAMPVSDMDRKKILYELKKFESAQGQDKNNLGDWINQICTFPWGKTTAHPIDFSLLRAEMDVTHYGLPEIKDTLLEHMVIEKIAGKKVGGVLCFTGPAGTGKTSIAKTLARVSGRKCFSLPLGGVTDEAEIRGHRRTYVSSKAGRIVNILQQADCVDPVIILDEIDKSPFKGGYSPVTSALLEVLDPQQNNAFLDKYLEIPIDLTNVLFICTANDIDGVPPALRDRMEIIEFREYTIEERRTIIKDYMIPSVMKDYCLTEFPITFEDSAIEYFSTEVQLRQIELKLRKLLKRIATQIYLKQRESFTATASSIGEVFGEKIQRSNLKRIGF
jgi:hypothetical protein